MREGKTHLGLQSEKQCGRGERDWKYNKEMGYNHYKDFNFRMETKASKEPIKTAQSKCVKPKKKEALELELLPSAIGDLQHSKMGGFTLVVFAVFFNLPKETQKQQRPTQRCLKRCRFGETKKNVKKRRFELFCSFFFFPFIYVLCEL